MPHRSCANGRTTRRHDLVGMVGLEPTQPNDNCFTDSPRSTISGAFPLHVHAGVPRTELKAPGTPACTKFRERMAPLAFAMHLFDSQRAVDTPQPMASPKAPFLVEYLRLASLHGPRDLNSQRPVLETGALPIELDP